MSQESDCINCSPLSISQETLDLMLRSVSDKTSIVCNNFTQIAARDPLHETDLQFPVEDGDTSLFMDKFEIATGHLVKDTCLQTAESIPLHTNQVSLLQNNSVVLNSVHCDHSNSNTSNLSCHVLQLSMDSHRPYWFCSRNKRHFADAPAILQLQLNRLQKFVQSTNVNMMQPLPDFQSKFPSSVPFGGGFFFEMSLTAQSKGTKAADWAYSELLRKVFLKFGQSCPFRFRTSVRPPSGTLLRAMPLYLRPQNVQEAVKRCPTHAAKTAPDNIGVTAPADHLVRCDHKLARYEQDSYTGFRSVVLPYEHPPEGIDWTIYLYQFTCFSSCVGGLNRRPVQVVFSLESVDGNVLGRQAIEVRICACPGRDRHIEEKNSPPLSSTQINPNEKLPTVTNEMTTNNLPAKRRRLEEDEVFSLSVRGRENYEILHHMRDALEVACAIPSAQLEKVKRQQEEFRQGRNVNSAKSVSEFNNSGLPSSSLSAGSAIAETQRNVQKVPQSLPCGGNCASVKSENNVETDTDNWLIQRGLTSCSAVFRKNKVLSISQLKSLSLEDLERFGLSDDLLAAVWLALSRDSRRQACKKETTSVQVSNTQNVSLAGNEPPSIVPSNSDSVFEYTRHGFKRRLSLPKENVHSQST